MRNPEDLCDTGMQDRKQYLCSNTASPLSQAPEPAQRTRVATKTACYSPVRDVSTEIAPQFHHPISTTSLSQIYYAGVPSPVCSYRGSAQQFPKKQSPLSRGKHKSSVSWSDPFVERGSSHGRRSSAGPVADLTLNTNLNRRPPSYSETATATPYQTHESFHKDLSHPPGYSQNTETFRDRILSVSDSTEQTKTSPFSQNRRISDGFSASISTPVKKRTGGILDQDPEVFLAEEAEPQSGVWDSAASWASWGTRRLSQAVNALSPGGGRDQV